MKKLLLTLGFLSFGFYSFAQGLNNDYEFDKTDIAKLFQLEKIDVYKFKLPLQDENHYDLILFHYKNGVLKDSFNFAYLFKNEISKYGASLLPFVEEGKDNFLRVYSKNTNNTIDLQLSLNGFATEREYDFNGNINFGSRAFDVDFTNMSTRIRLMAVYATKDKELHCAQEDSDDALSKRMDDLVLIYLEKYKPI